MPPNIRLDALKAYMPDVVLEEIRLHGDPEVVGWSPLLKQWLKTSTHPRIEKWRNDLKKFTRKHYEQALQRQQKMSELSRELYPTGNGSIRRTAVIDPVLMDFNSDSFKGPGLEQTKRDEPKIFIERK